MGSVWRRRRAERDVLVLLGVIIVLLVLFLDYRDDQKVSIATWAGFLSNVGSGLIGAWIAFMVSARYEPSVVADTGKPQAQSNNVFPEELRGALVERNPDLLIADDRKYGASDVAA